MTPYYSPAPLGNNTHAAQCGQDNYEIAFEILYTCHMTFFNVSISKRTENQKSLVKNFETLQHPRTFEMAPKSKKNIEETQEQ